MALSTQELEQALIGGTSEVFRAEPDGTSVNKVRRHVEERLGLEEGFFSKSSWKQKSKALIKGHVDKLLDGWNPDTEEHDSKNVLKRQSSDVKSPDPKRQKRGSKAGKPVKREAADASDSDQKADMKKGAKRSKPLDIGAVSLDDSFPDQKPKIKKDRGRFGSLSPEPKSGRKGDQGHGNSLKIERDELGSPSREQKLNTKKDKGRGTLKNDPDRINSPSPDRRRKRNVKMGSEEESKKTTRSGSGDEEAQVKTGVDSGDEESLPVKRQVESDSDAKSSINVEEARPTIDEEEDYSDVIDELPQRKKNLAERNKKNASLNHSNAHSKKASISASTSDDPREAEIKKLQSHLVKCGIRKVWHNELKKYGSDALAKIRHLKKMLAEVGMEGRFSEAKAREIRETRELLAETEAAQEMNRLWGMSSGGRASRSKSKTLKADESEESGAGDVKDEDEDEDDEDTTFAARRRRAQADLAFLGDDSDSD